MRPVLPELAVAFERSGGPKLSINYVAPPEIKSRAEAGDSVDLVITLKGHADALAKEGKLSGVVTAARSPIVVAIPAGKPKPDISSASAFKTALLNARAVVISNGGPSGLVAARIIKSLGIEEQIEPKLKKVPPGGQALPAAIASGVADLGIDQLIVLQNKPGIQVVGRLPNEFTADIIMGAGVASSGSAGAASFIKFLKSPEASAAIQAHGMMPD